MTPPDDRASETFRSVLDLAHSKDGRDYALLLVKYTYEIRGGYCRLREPEPLLHDFRDENLKPRLRPGTDFWHRKRETDFVVQGAAYGPGQTSVRQMYVSVGIGRTFKKAKVFGKRFVEWKRGKVLISPPEPFRKMPLTYANTYGGVDFRVRISEEGKRDSKRLFSYICDRDHPGLYPRNPFGKGYLVEQEEVEGMQMPNVEDPGDLLTPERLIVGDPRYWYRQPLPCSFDWVSPAVFPRYLYLAPGADAWHPAPEDDSMPEIRAGYMPAGYRSLMRDRPLEKCPHPLFFQEASHGLRLRDVRGDETVCIEGMHPEEPVIRFCLPDHIPRVEFCVAGEKQQAAPRIHSIVCRPAEKRLTVLFAADVDTPKRFMPGIHKTIPVSARIDSEKPVRYDAPPTIRELLDNAKKTGGNLF